MNVPMDLYKERKQELLDTKIKIQFVGRRDRIPTTYASCDRANRSKTPKPLRTLPATLPLTTGRTMNS
jgi:hypothetical protein